MDMDISMGIHAKSGDMDMDMDGKFHIHGNPWLLGQLSVASLSHPAVFLQCYSLLLLYFGQINDNNPLPHAI